MKKFIPKGKKVPMTNINLYVSWKSRNVEEREQKVTFAKNASLNEFLKYLASDILFIKINDDVPIIMWGKTNMSLFMEMQLNDFFIDGNSIYIDVPKSAEWIQTDVEIFDIPDFKSMEIPPIAKQIDDYEIFVIDKLLSEKECLILIELAEKMKFKSIDYNKDYRSNDRLMAVSKNLHDVLFKRIVNLVPQKINEWSISGLNPQFRFCRYEAGQLFTKHLDGRFIKSLEEKSFFTVNIYLNEDFEDGNTRFYLDSTDTNIITHSFKPSTGLAVIFNHETCSYLHDGQVVTSGRKYLLRTDIMYKR